METVTIIIVSLIGAMAGAGIGFYFVNNIFLKKKKEEILKEAQAKGESIKKEKIFQAKEK